MQPKSWFAMQSSIPSGTPQKRETSIISKISSGFSPTSQDLGISARPPLTPQAGEARSAWSAWTPLALPGWLPWLGLPGISPGRRVDRSKPPSWELFSFGQSWGSHPPILAKMERTRNPVHVLVCFTSGLLVAEHLCAFVGPRRPRHGVVWGSDSGSSGWVPGLRIPGLPRAFSTAPHGFPRTPGSVHVPRLRLP